jgi:hypothetical protein
MAALCLWLARVPAAAQSTPEHVVEGVVRDTTGAVMVGVDVTLMPAEMADPRATVTDTSGRFQFGRLPSGTYTVAAAAAGFAEASRQVAITAEPVLSVELVMQVLVTELVRSVSESRDVGLDRTGGDDADRRIARSASR